MTISFENFAKTFQLIEESFANFLSIIRIQVILVIVRALFQMIRHHDCVLQQEEVWWTAKLFNLGQRPWWGRLCPNWHQFAELKFVFRKVLCVFSIQAWFATTHQKLGINLLKTYKKLLTLPRFHHPHCFQEGYTQNEALNSIKSKDNSHLQITKIMSIQTIKKFRSSKKSGHKAQKLVSVQKTAPKLAALPICLK